MDAASLPATASYTTFCAEGRGGGIIGSIPGKFFAPPTPYGSSQTNVVNQAQGPGINPQTPLLPPNFLDPGTMNSASSPLKSATGAKSPLQPNPGQFNPFRGVYNP